MMQNYLQLVILMYLSFAELGGNMREDVDKCKAKKEYNKRWKKQKRRRLSEKRKLRDDQFIESSDEEEVNVHVPLNPVDRNEDVEFTHSSQIENNTDSVNMHSETDECYDHARAWDEIDDECSKPFNSESDTDSDDGDEELIELLRSWANEFQVRANVVDGILKVFRQLGHTEVPATARTLLKTPRSVKTTQVSSMCHYDFGLEDRLVDCLKNYPSEALESIETLELALNIDGLPLFKSTNTSAWPILCYVANVIPAKVFPISVSVGTSKPSNLDFLEDAIDGLQKAVEEGLDFNGKHYKVSIKCVVCDAPAKAMVKGIKLYSGYFGCDNCSQKGEYEGRIIYPVIYDSQLRTDATFRSTEQPEHHHHPTPFLKLPIDMIQDFPLDYMHQVCLGVARRLYLIWKKGPREPYRLSAGQLREINDRFVVLKQSVPREFARKPRGLNEMDRWKATEFRQSLLYTGQFAFKGIVPDIYYNHFLLFSVAICILVSPTLVSRHGRYANQLLHHFVSRGVELYGREFLVYNVHSLTHLHAAALRFGCLDNCAAWKFESYLHSLKKKVRSGKNPTVQIVKRVLEEKGQQEVSKPSKKIRHKRPDNAYKTNDGKYCQVVHTNPAEGTYMCRIYHSPEPLYTNPCDSRILGFCKVKKQNYHMKSLAATSLLARCMMKDEGRKLVFLTLLHEL